MFVFEVPIEVGLDLEKKKKKKIKGKVYSKTLLVCLPQT